MGYPDEPFLCPLGLRSRVIELISLDGQEPQLRIITISSWFGHFSSTTLLLEYDLMHFSALLSTCIYLFATLLFLFFNSRCLFWTKRCRLQKQQSQRLVPLLSKKFNQQRRRSEFIMHNKCTAVRVVERISAQDGLKTIKM